MDRAAVACDRQRLETARTVTGRRNETVAVGCVTLLALALRLFRIDAQSAWFDEAFTIHAGASRWGEMLRILIDDFNHPPLHSLLVHWWFDLFAVGVLQARVLSAIFGTLAVAALYWLGVLLFDRRTALIGSFLLAISQLGIIYSQEARAYSLLLFLFIVASGFFVRAFRSGSIRDFALFVVTASLMLYTHYYAVFALAGLLIYALVFRRRSSISASWWMAALVVVTIAYLPWFASGVIESAVRNPRGAVDNRLFAHLASPLYALNWFNNGKLVGVRDQAPWWTFPLGCVLFTAPALIALRRPGTARSTDTLGSLDRERHSVSLLALLWVVPVLAVSSLGILHIIYDVRHVSFAVAPYYLLVARGITLVTPATLRRLLVVAILGYSALSFRADYFIPYKENYRDPMKVLATQSRAGDCSIFGASESKSTAGLYWDAYYHGQAPPEIIRLDEALSRSDCKRVWLVWDKTWWVSDAQTYSAFREEMANAYRPGPQWSFTGMDVLLYFPRQD